MTDPETLADRVQAAELSLYELESHTDADTATAARRELLARECEGDLEAIGSYGFDAALAEPNIENMMGAVQIPMGVAGPLPVSGGVADGEYRLPLATTEGALVASINRGCRTLAASGGATARVLSSGMTRAPVFSVEDVAEAQAVLEWVEANEARLAERAESTTNHGELQELTPYVVGDSVFLRFDYDTKDAMGMNMATIATEAAADLIVEKTSASLVSLSGNLCSDKKPAAINAVEGRGHTVVADVTIDAETVARTVGTTPEAMAELNTRKNLVGSAKAGSLGFNAHVANVVAAIFLATGQDEAHVVEGSNAITTIEDRGDAVYASVTLSSLQAGTVGGGTALPSQAEALELLGVRGGGDPPGTNADELAEILAAGALAGELSLIADLASNNLASTHADLGR